MLIYKRTCVAQHTHPLYRLMHSHTPTPASSPTPVPAVTTLPLFFPNSSGLGLRETSQPRGWMVGWREGDVRVEVAGLG